MQDIFEYIQRPQSERQTHLKLETPCDERGGFSSYCKALLAYHCDTSIPSGKKVHVCHACHNARCSNVSHLYWGTPSENRRDAMSDGAKSIWANMVEKYGEAEAKRRQWRGKDHMSKMGKIGASKPRSKESNEKRAIANLGTRRATDGVKTITLKEGETLPEGFNYGMRPRNKLP